MLFDDVVHRVVDHLVQLENMMDEKRIFVHQMNVTAMVQKKNSLVKGVNDA
jgi:hypothetical protein